MKEIKLTQGKVALVDDEDYEYLNQFKWSFYKSRKTYYANRIKTIKGKGYGMTMHRVIMNTPSNMEVDHIDHNGLNNQKHNLRNCTFTQNRKNKTASGKSKYLGVGFAGKQIQAHILNLYLGSFKTEEDAARAYDNAARKYHGEFANLNIIKNGTRNSPQHNQ